MATSTISAIGTVTIYDGIDKVDASSIKNFGTLLYGTDGENYSAAIPTATDAGTYTYIIRWRRMSTGMLLMHKAWK